MSHLLDAMRARLEPQAPSVERQSRMSETLRACLSPPVTAPMSKWLSQLPRQQAEVPLTQVPLDSISRRLDDILSTPFNPHIINYEPPRGFVVPKFMMYNGMSDPFNHIMHFRQLMNLNIRNDALMCKVFSASLHDPTLSWFHHLPLNFVNTFQDILEAFIGYHLCPARQKQNISILQNIKLQENESLRDFMK